MAPFLEFSGATGNILHVRLPQSEPFATCFLPDQVKDNINLSPFRTCNGHSTVRLQIYNGHLLLSVWDVDTGPVFILNSDGACTEVPISTQSREILLMLTNRCQFLSPAGRWKVDIAHNEPTSRSMMPPPLPYRTVNPRDLSYDDPKMPAKDDDENDDKNEDINAEDFGLDLVENSGKLDGAGKPITSTTIGLGASIADLQSKQARGRQSQHAVVESIASQSLEPATVSVTSSTTLVSETPSTPRRKKLIDMEEHKDVEPQVITPRPRKRVRFNSDVSMQSPTILAEFTSEHLRASPLQAKQDVLHRKPGEESQELRAPPIDTQEGTDSADEQATPARNNESKTVDHRHKVWPYCSFTVLPSQPKVVFSSNCTVQTRRKTMSTFARLGGEVVSEVEQADILCVPSGPIKRTTKFVLAIALAKVVVVEDWIVQSSRQQKLQCIEKYIPKDKIREQQWNFSLLEAMKRSPLENKKTLKGWKVYVTPQLTKELGGLVTDFEKIAKALGVHKLQRGLPTKQTDPESALILADDNDVNVEKLGQMGFDVHRKDALVLAALRGYHDIHSNEFTF